MAARAQQASSEVTDWLGPRLAWILIPSWFASLVFHGTFAAAVWYLVQTPGCRATRGEQVGEPGGRSVGIFVRGDGDGDGGDPVAATSPASDSSLPPVEATADLVSAIPTDVLKLPNEPPVAVLGGGPPRGALDSIPSISPGAVTDPGGESSGSRVRGGAPGSRGGGGGDGQGTSLFGVQTKGKKFLYVIDHSSSMYDVLPAAKGQLLASLERLDAEQQFAVVFFNEHVQEISSRTGLFHGTDHERLIVQQRLRSISAEGGTERLPALLKAFEFGPDVVYFLTDSEEAMPAADLDRIRRSRRGAQIHCIEFGEGPQATDANGRPARNFLNKLADDSGGSYVYFEIKRLPQP